MVIPSTANGSPSPSVFGLRAKHGLWDGAHMANWGDAYPIFARVVLVGGETMLFAVGREQQAGQPFLGQMVKLNRAFMRQVFPDNANGTDYAVCFADLPHQQADSSIAATAFVQVSTSPTYRHSPTPALTIEVEAPGVVTPPMEPMAPVAGDEPTPVVTLPVVPGPSPAIIPPITVVNGAIAQKQKRLTTLLWVVVGGGVLLVGLVLTVFIRKQLKNG